MWTSNPSLPLFHSVSTSTFVNVVSKWTEVLAVRVIRRALPKLTTQICRALDSLSCPATSLPSIPSRNPMGSSWTRSSPAVYAPRTTPGLMAGSCQRPNCSLWRCKTKGSRSYLPSQWLGEVVGKVLALSPAADRNELFPFEVPFWYAWSVRKEGVFAHPLNL